MTKTDADPPSAEFLGAFRRRAGPDGVLSFADFMALALYDDAVGYYSQCRRRIGREGETDFYTAASIGPLFGELVTAACVDLLGDRRPARDHVFVEIGADRAGGVIANIAHPFGGMQTISPGQPLAPPPRAVVFSNELFDAQPCHRLIHRRGAWRETGVTLRATGFEEVLLPDLSPEVQTVRDRLPATAPEGYRLDLPLAAARLAQDIVGTAWSGLFVAFDYGKSWRELAEATPAGTARAYHRHRQSNDLLARPGEQDLTCHICWDWINDALIANGFAPPTLESQEEFFVRHAAPALSRLVSAEAGRFSPRKQGLMQLLHPASMGQKFQVLWALRGFGCAKT